MHFFCPSSLSVATKNMHTEYPIKFRTLQIRGNWTLCLAKLRQEPIKFSLKIGLQPVLRQGIVPSEFALGMWILFKPAETSQADLKVSQSRQVLSKHQFSDRCLVDKNWSCIGATMDSKVLRWFKVLPKNQGLLYLLYALEKVTEFL